MRLICVLSRCVSFVRKVYLLLMLMLVCVCVVFDLFNFKPLCLVSVLRAPGVDLSFGLILIFFNKFILRKVWRFQKLAVPLHHTNTPPTSNTNKRTPNSTPDQSTLLAMKDTAPPTTPTATTPPTVWTSPTFAGQTHIDWYCLKKY